MSTLRSIEDLMKPEAREKLGGSRNPKWRAEQQRHARVRAPVQRIVPAVLGAAETDCGDVARRLG